MWDGHGFGKLPLLSACAVAIGCRQTVVLWLRIAAELASVTMLGFPKALLRGRLVVALGADAVIAGDTRGRAQCPGEAVAPPRRWPSPRSSASCPCRLAWRWRCDWPSSWIGRRTRPVSCCSTSGTCLGVPHTSPATSFSVAHVVCELPLGLREHGAAVEQSCALHGRHGTGSSCASRPCTRHSLGDPRWCSPVTSRSAPSSAPRRSPCGHRDLARR